MKKNNTYESRSQTRNGIKRALFSLIAILLEFVILLLLYRYLSTYAVWINTIIQLLGMVIVLVIYSQNKTATMKMPWIMLILLFPVMGVVIYLLIGLNGGTAKMRKRFEKIDEELIPNVVQDEGVIEALEQKYPNAAHISRYIHNNAAFPCYDNSDVTYFDDAAKGLDEQLAEMRKAKKFIFMEYHAIEDDISWKRIQDVLEEKVKEGIEVRVFYDDIGSIGFVNTDFVKKLEAVGIHARVFNPVAPGLNIFLNNRDHRKITVIDNKVGFTGGYNLANEYFNITHPYGLWKDSGIRIEGQAVQSLTVTFLLMWNASNKKDEPESDVHAYCIPYDYQPKEHCFIQPYADSPMYKEQVAEEVYINMVSKAQKYCWFITPYLILTDEMTHAMSLAAKSGVDVRIITPGIPDKKMIYGMTRSFYNGLVRNGVRIFEWEPGFCHEKMSIADDCMATCGTINLDYRSLYHHFENGCFMADCQAVLDIKHDFEQTFPQCREVTEDYKDGNRKSYMRLSQLFLRLFAQLL